eukprot:12011811-Heterocapsa_arctica.AAC.1
MGIFPRPLPAHLWAQWAEHRAAARNAIDNDRDADMEADDGAIDRWDIAVAQWQANVPIRHSNGRGR